MPKESVQNIRRLCWVLFALARTRTHSLHLKHAHAPQHMWQICFSLEDARSCHVAQKRTCCLLAGTPQVHHIHQCQIRIPSSSDSKLFHADCPHPAQNHLGRRRGLGCVRGHPNECSAGDTVYLSQTHSQPIFVLARFHEIRFMTLDSFTDSPRGKDACGPMPLETTKYLAPRVAHDWAQIKASAADVLGFSSWFPNA